MEIFNTIADQERIIGEMLIERGHLDQSKLEEIIKSAEENDTKFGESAIQLGHVSEEGFLKVFSEQILPPYVDLKFFNIERSALEFLDKETARRLIAVPLFEAGNILAIGFHDPLNLDAIDEIELKTGKTVQVILCSKELLKNVKICDPSVGTGAFLVEVSNLISITRKKLDLFLNKDRNNY